jgi:hypothetical protein
VNDWITTDIPMTGYVPGTTYTITLTGTHSGVGKFGFELTAEDNANSKVGTFVITDATQTQLKNGGNAVTHTGAGTSPSGNAKTWTVDWTAPSAGTGDVGFYAAFNAANGNGNTAGDVVYTTSTFVMEEAPAPEITGIVPNQANQGQNVAVTISGSGTSWTGAADVNLSFSGNPSEVIWATNVTAPNGTTIQCNFVIPTDASIGLWDVNVEDLTLENGFSVIEVIQSILAINPGMANQGDEFTGMITGANTNWSGTPNVLLSFHDNPSEVIQGTDVSVISPTQVNANFDIPLDASPGMWDVHVDDLVKENGFTVNELIQLLMSIQPDSAIQGDMLTVLITGNNTLWNGTMPEVSLIFSSNPSEVIEAISVNVISDLELEADLSIPGDASVGLWNVHVDDLSLIGAFEVHLLTGLEELSFAELEAYPNPTDGVLNLNISEDAEVRIHDITGNLIELYRLTAGSNTLDLGSYPAGLYFLSIIGTGKADQLKIIVR